MVRDSSTKCEAREHLVGRRLWLEYADQNTEFDAAFKSQYGTVIRQFDGGEDRDDWYLVRLKQSFDYGGATHDHLIISSRWAGERVGSEQPTSVFVVLAPEPETLGVPFEPDRKLFIAWGTVGESKESIDKRFKRDE